MAMCTKEVAQELDIHQKTMQIHKFRVRQTTNADMDIKIRWNIQGKRTDCNFVAKQITPILRLLNNQNNSKTIYHYWNIELNCATNYNVFMQSKGLKIKWKMYTIKAGPSFQI